MTREVARSMVDKGDGGRIINIGSAALVGSIVKGLAAYVGSKGALLALSRASALELVEYGITVNTVLPGGVATPGAMAAKGPPVEGPGRRRPPLGMCEPRGHWCGGRILRLTGRALHYQPVRRNGEWKLAALRLTRLHIDVHPPLAIGSRNY